MPNYMLRISFVGSRYHGWQIQPGLPTVQGTLTDALERILSHRVRLVGCCRTDAGVHARDYVANFTTHRELSEEKLLLSLNSLLPKDIGVLAVRKMPEGFNARYSPKGKVYAYLLWNAPCRDPFLYNFSWHVPRPLDRDLMRRAVELVSGEHEFSGFAKLEGERNTRINLRVSLREEGCLLRFEFEASHFLRYMVRRITGAVVRVGMGKVSLEDIEEFLQGRKCPYSAPPHGLTLERVIL